MWSRPEATIACTPEWAPDHSILRGECPINFQEKAFPGRRRVLLLPRIFGGVLDQRAAQHFCDEQSVSKQVFIPSQLLAAGDKSCTRGGKGP